jgi:DNA-binding response OmpR family regulator
MKLMIIDDSEKFRRRLASIISGLGSLHIAGQAGSIQQALKCFLKKKPDIVILDIQLADGSGLDVLRLVKAVDRAVIAIMLTVCPAGEYRSKCLAMGADYYFEKSNGIGEMMSLLEKLSRRAKARENRRGHKKNSSTNTGRLDGQKHKMIRLQPADVSRA